MNQNTTTATGAENTTAAHNTLAAFTSREDALITKLKAANFDLSKLPERLSGWRFWIGDSAIYLHELKNFVEDELTRINRIAA